jgi:probable HAF family extracellular repeat protein
MLDLGTLGGDTSWAYDVDGTIVVGQSEAASGGWHGFAYDLAAPEPAMVDLGTLGGDTTWAYDVDGTTVVGGSETAAGESRAFAYDLAAPEPTMVDLGTLGGGYSYATAVDGTIVVGTSRTAAGESRAFAYDLAADEPTMVDLGTLGGGWSSAVAVDGTIVVGSSRTASGKERAFAYDLAAAEPVMRDLGTVPGGSRTRVGATAIDGDIVIGTWQADRPGSSHSLFVYDLGADEPMMLDLGTWRYASGPDDIDGDVVVGHSDSTKDHTWHATAWVLRDTTRPMIAFERFERGVKESAGRVRIRVTRYGRTDRAVTVRYRIRAFTTNPLHGLRHAWPAEAGKDFVARSGKLRFPPGVARRSFKVKILDDRKRERDEYLLLTLSRPSKPAVLGTPSWSQLRIKDNDR